MNLKRKLQFRPQHSAHGQGRLVRATAPEVTAEARLRADDLDSGWRLLTYVAGLRPCGGVPPPAARLCLPETHCQTDRPRGGPVLGVHHPARPQRRGFAQRELSQMVGSIGLLLEKRPPQGQDQLSLLAEVWA